jgi:hypothetical protein
MEDNKEEKFSYCIGRPWYPEDPNSSICTYAYGSTVFHGTAEQAEGMRKFIEGRCDEEKKYSVYKLVKV